MFEIKIYLKKPVDQGGSAAGDERFVLLTDDLLEHNHSDVPTAMYIYGKVVIRNEWYVLLDEECELDFFVSCLQSDKGDIFSGKAHSVDNSYFKLVFVYRGKLTISFGSRSMVVDKQEFIDAFRTAAERYYQLFAAVKVDRAYYEQQAKQIRAGWPPSGNTSRRL